MLSLVTLSASIAAVSAVSAAPHSSRAAQTIPYAAGFQKAYLTPSIGGAAVCVQGNIPVTASGQNYKLNYDTPANQSVITETIVEMLQVNSTLSMEVLGPKVNVSGTYIINSKLCYPAADGKPNSDLVQILTHGVGFDKSYWDFFSAQYSYQDAAAIAGYTTFSYDRLGIGASEHPDGIQIVQGPLEIGIAHSLIQMLRSGTIGDTAFSKVVGVGHSFGSEITEAITAMYPKDLDAAVLTGFSTDSTGQGNFIAGLDLVIASVNAPDRFSTLSPAYLVSANIVGNQFAFFCAPNFDPLLLAAAEATKQTLSLGEVFTLAELIQPAEEFTGPVDVVDGQNDLPFCQSNCLYPENQAAAVKGMLYPLASNGSSYYIGSGAGHGLNLHYVAPESYQHIFGFIEANGF